MCLTQKGKGIMILILSACFLLAACTGCAREASEGTPPPQSFEGFQTEGEATGGGTLLNANINAVGAAEENGDVRLTLGFIGGSRMSGGTDEREVANVPRYAVTLLPQPTRLAVSFDSITYWDYLRDLDLSASGFLLGSFGTVFEGSEAFTLYFQLAGEAAFQVVEHETSIEILLRPIAAQAAEPEAQETPAADAIDIVADEYAAADERYYVVANAFEAYCAGTFSSGCGMTPVLAADHSTVLLISEGVSAKSEAERLRERILTEEPGAVPSDWSVVKLKNGALPAYDETMEYMAAYDQLPARIDGKETALTPLIPDGLLLSVTPQRDGFLYSRRITRGSLAETYTYEQLCVQSMGGVSKPLLSFEFQTIESANYSPDGRRLAVLERAAESAHLYIFDLDTKELLTDLTDMGFGDTVSAYVWDSMGGRVFSIGGSGEISIHQYDFNVPTESKRHTVVDRKGVDEGSLAFFDGELYFCETTLEGGGMIYRIKPEGGTRRSYMEGSAFALSGDGRYMAFSASGDDALGGGETHFGIRDMHNGALTTITDEFSVYTFLWSYDGSRLYYIENRLSGSAGEETESTGDANDAYPYRLWVYDIASGESRTIADLPYASIAVSHRADEVYLCYTDGATLGDVVRATYIIPAG